MAVDLTETWIDARAPRYRAMLANLQGGILKSHGRNHVRLLVFQFTAGRRPILMWMADFAGLYLTSAQQQQEEARRFQVNSAPGAVFGSLFLTAQAYRKILGPEMDLEALFPEPLDPRPERRVEALWREGMEAAGRPAVLDDPPLQPPYAGRQVDGMVLLADDDPRRLERTHREAGIRLSRVARILVTEEGTVLRNARGDSIEPFGYRDGLSQPLFLRQDLTAAGQEEGRELQPWSPQAPLGLALVADPVTRTPDAFGSYLVFRKLEQDVKKFRDTLTNLAGYVGHSSTELAGAMAMGRFEDGTPVLLSSSPTDNVTNEFDYSDLRSARKCPFHALSAR